MECRQLRHLAGESDPRRALRRRIQLGGFSENTGKGSYFTHRAGPADASRSRDSVRGGHANPKRCRSNWSKYYRRWESGQWKGWTRVGLGLHLVRQLSPATVRLEFLAKGT